MVLNSVDNAYREDKSYLYALLAFNLKKYENEKTDEIKSAIEEICAKIQLNFNDTPNIEAGIIEK